MCLTHFLPPGHCYWIAAVSGAPNRRERDAEMAPGAARVWGFLSCEPRYCSGWKEERKTSLGLCEDTASRCAGDSWVQKGGCWGRMCWGWRGAGDGEVLGTAGCWGRTGARKGWMLQDRYCRGMGGSSNQARERNGEQKLAQAPHPRSRPGGTGGAGGPRRGAAPPALAQWPRSAIPHGFPGLSPRRLRQAGRSCGASPTAR